MNGHVYRGHGDRASPRLRLSRAMDEEIRMKRKKRDSPQALHIVLPSASLLQRGVDVVWQLLHSVGRGGTSEVSTCTSEALKDKKIKDMSVGAKIRQGLEERLT